MVVAVVVDSFCVSRLLCGFFDVDKQSFFEGILYLRSVVYSEGYSSEG